MRKILFWLLLIGTAVAQQVNTNILPASPGLSLGTFNQRWQGFFTNVNISGTCTLNGSPCFGGGGAGGGPITVNGGAIVPYPINFQDGTGIHFSFSGSNVIAGLVNTISPSTVVCPTITYNAQGQLTNAVAGSCSGGGGSPGGVVTNLQFNDSTFGGAFNFTFNKATGESQSANLNKIRSPSPIVGTTFNWLQTDVAGSIGNLAATGTKTLNLACGDGATGNPVPCIGMDTSNNTGKPYSVYISTVGTPEAALVVGGTCGLFATANCTLTVITTQTHGAGFTVQSAYGGIQEAMNDAGTPNAKIVLQPVGANANAYQILAPIYFESQRATLEGEGSFIKCFTRSACLILGDLVNVNDVLNIKVHGLRIGSGTNVAGVAVSNTERTGCPGAGCQINITTGSPHPFIVGDYIDIQMTNDVSFWGIWKITSSADNTHFSALYSAAVNGPGQNTNAGSAASIGQVALANSAIWDNASTTVISEIQFESGSAGPAPTGTFHNGIVVFNDQAGVIDKPELQSGTAFRCDSTYCANGIYGPGPFSPNAGIIYVRGGNLGGCHLNAITNYNGNTLSVSDTVIQAFDQWAINSTNIRGGFGTATLTNVYNEVGGCSNPQYTGATLASKQAEAGLIGGGTVRGGESPTGNMPSFSCVGTGGANSLYYWVVIKDSVVGTSAPLLAGNTPANCSGNVTVQWPRVQGSNTVTYDIIRNAATGTGIIAPSIGGCGGGSNLACGSAATAQAQCGAQVCSFTDNAAASTSNYTVTVPNYYPRLFFWPGLAVEGTTVDTNSINNVSHLYLENALTTPQSNIITETSWQVPSVFAHECFTPTPGVWVSCLAENSAGNNSLGATILQPGIATGGISPGFKGRISFPWNTVVNGDWITLVDTNPSLTIATGTHRPAVSAADTGIGSDNASAVAATSAAMAFFAPAAISNYINTLRDGTSWLERLTAARKEFSVPLLMDSDAIILGSPIGFSPFTKSGSQATDTCVRADGALGANWTVTDGTWAIASNTCTSTAIGGDGFALAAYTALTFANDQQAQARMINVTGANSGVCVRMSNATSTAYCMYASGGGSALVKIVAGVGTGLATGAAYAVGDIIGISAQGTTITGYKNGVPFLSGTSATIASGYPGIVAGNLSGTKLTGWKGGDLTWGTTNPLSVQDITINGTCTGCATGTVTASGTLTATAILTGNGTTVVTAPSATTTLSAGGDLSTPGSYISTAVNGGIFGTEGTGNCTPGAGVDCIYWDAALHGSHLNNNNVDQGLAIGTRSFQAVYNHSGTQATTPHVVQDRCTLGTDCVVTLTGSAVFTSSSTYDCIVVDRTSAAAAKFAPSSGSAFTLTGTGTDLLSYVCVGN